MRWIYALFVILSFSQFQCDNAEVAKKESTCSKTATVKDLTGLGGCKFVLELTDGSRLVPQKLTYIQAPDSTQDPGYYFKFVNGQNVCFDHRETEGVVDTCMAGKLVFLTCIRVCEGGSNGG